MSFKLGCGEGDQAIHRDERRGNPKSSRLLYPNAGKCVQDLHLQRNFYPGQSGPAVNIFSAYASFVYARSTTSCPAPTIHTATTTRGWCL